MLLYKKSSILDHLQKEKRQEKHKSKSPSKFAEYSRFKRQREISMGNSLRCCLACVLPFGALDLIRIVHLNGFVEEMTGPITAGEILKANPNHVLSKPSSEGVVRRIVIVSPDSELKRGSIYFLSPSSSLPEKKKKCNTNNRKPSKKTKKSYTDDQTSPCDRHLTDVTSEKKSSRRDRRSRGRITVWQPRLESISED